MSPNIPKRIVVGISGASGIIYGVRALQTLKRLGVETHLVMTRAAQVTLAHELTVKVAEVNAGTIVLPDHPRVISQLAALERRTARSGKDTIDHPPGGYDDLANVIAGAAALCSQRNDAPRLQIQGAWTDDPPRERSNSISFCTMPQRRSVEEMLRQSRRTPWA